MKKDIVKGLKEAIDEILCYIQCLTINAELDLLTAVKIDKAESVKGILLWSHSIVVARSILRRHDSNR